MDKRVREIRRGLRLSIKKPPKAETPKNIYKRKQKHKYGRDYEDLRPYFFLWSQVSMRQKPLLLRKADVLAAYNPRIYSGLISEGSLFSKTPFMRASIFSRSF